MQARCPILLAAILPFLVFSFALHSVRSCMLIQLRQPFSCHLSTMTCVHLASIAAGFLLPGMLRLFHEGRALLPSLGGFLRVTPLAAVFLLPAFAFLFDNDGWEQNQALCLAVCVSYGFMVTGSFLVMFGNLSARRRTLWLGIYCGGGVLVGKQLSALFKQYYLADPAGSGEIVLGFYTAVNFLMAVVIFYALTLRHSDNYQPFFSESGSAQRRQPYRKIYLMLAYVTLILMNGVLDSILLPLFNVPNPSSWWPLPMALSIFCPLVGWLVDRDPDVWVPSIFACCGVFFLMAPSLNVIGHESWLFTALHTFCSVCQALIFMVMAVAMSGLVTNAVEAAAYTGFLFGIRIVSPYFENLLDFYPVLTAGTKVLTTTVLAGLYYFLIYRAWHIEKIGIAEESHPQPPQQINLAHRPPAAAEEIPFPGAAPIYSPGTFAPLLEAPGAGEETGEKMGESQPGLPYPALDSETAWPLTSVDLPRAFTNYLDSAALTPREREIAKELLGGRTTRGISQRLGISENTVNYHVKNILDKFNVASRYAFLARFINSREDA